jgi:hypothetical protein
MDDWSLVTLESFGACPPYNTEDAARVLVLAF